MPPETFEIAFNLTPPKFYNQLRFLILKKTLLLHVTLLGCNQVDVSAWASVNRHHFGIYKSESLVKDDESFEEWTYNGAAL